MQTTLEMYLIMVTKVGQWNQAENIITGYQASQKKAERHHSFVPMHHDINLLERNWRDHTHLCSHAASTNGHMQTHMHKKHTQLKIEFHSWMCHFIGKMPKKISAVYWLAKVIFEMTVGIVLTRQADSRAKKRVRVCTQKLMLAFPQHCIVSCEGGSTVFHGNWLLPNPLAFTQSKGSWGWKLP